MSDEIPFDDTEHPFSPNVREKIRASKQRRQTGSTTLRKVLIQAREKMQALGEIGNAPKVPGDAPKVPDHDNDAEEATDTEVKAKEVSLRIRDIVSMVQNVEFDGKDFALYREELTNALMFGSTMGGAKGALCKFVVDSINDVDEDEFLRTIVALRDHNVSGAMADALFALVISNTLTKSIKRILRGKRAGHGSEQWVALQTRYEQDSKLDGVNALLDLVKLSMTADETVAEYGDKVKALRQKAEDAGEAITDKIVVSIFANGLRDEFALVKHQVLTNEYTHSNLDEAIAQALMCARNTRTTGKLHGHTAKVEKEEKDSAADSTPTQAMVAEYKKLKLRDDKRKEARKKKRGAKNVICYNCYQKGHYSKDCKNEKVTTEMLKALQKRKKVSDPPIFNCCTLTIYARETIRAMRATATDEVALPAGGIAFDSGCDGIVMARREHGSDDQWTTSLEKVQGLSHTIDVSGTGSWGELGKEGTQVTYLPDQFCSKNLLGVHPFLKESKLNAFFQKDSIYVTAAQRPPNAIQIGKFENGHYQLTPKFMKTLHSTKVKDLKDTMLPVYESDPSMMEVQAMRAEIRAKMSSSNKPTPAEQVMNERLMARLAAQAAEGFVLGGETPVKSVIKDNGGTYFKSMRATKNAALRFHRRHGHLERGIMAQMAKHWERRLTTAAIHKLGLFTVKEARSPWICHGCSVGHFPKFSHSGHSPMDEDGAWAVDLKVFANNDQSRCIYGGQYHATYVHLATGYAWSDVLQTKNKKAMRASVEKFLAHVENDPRHLDTATGAPYRVTKLFPDQGGEFKNSEVEALLRERNIHMKEMGAAEAHYYHGKAEVTIRIIATIASTILADAMLPDAFRWYAWKYATAALNRRPRNGNGYDSSREGKWHNNPNVERPAMVTVPPFGCTALVRTTDAEMNQEHDGKMRPRAYHAIYLHTLPDSGYQHHEIYLPGNVKKRVVQRDNVIFDEALYLITNDRLRQIKMGNYRAPPGYDIVDPPDDVHNEAVAAEPPEVTRPPRARKGYRDTEHERRADRVDTSETSTTGGTKVVASFKDTELNEEAMQALEQNAASKSEEEVDPEEGSGPPSEEEQEETQVERPTSPPARKIRRSRRKAGKKNYKSIAGVREYHTKARKAARKAYAAAVAAAEETHKTDVSPSTDDWATPQALKTLIDACFPVGKYDPFPLYGCNGLKEEWKERCKRAVYVNPPFSKLNKVTAKMKREYETGTEIIALLPLRTPKWYFKNVLPCKPVVIPIEGRIAFAKDGIEGEAQAKFDCALFVFSKDKMLRRMAKRIRIKRIGQNYVIASRLQPWQNIRAMVLQKDTQAHKWMGDKRMARKIKCPISLEWAVSEKCPEHKDWRKALENELENLMSFGVFKPGKLPKYAKLLKTKWVMSVPSNDDGTVKKFKVRYVGKGFAQKPGVDFDPNGCAAPVARETTNRILLSWALANGLMLRYLDFRGAFLQGVLKEELYVGMPPRFDVRRAFGLSPKEVDCLQLAKGIPGLKQSAMIWYERLEETLISLGFERSPHDPCLFIYEKEDGKMGVALHVDDVTAAVSSMKLWERVVKELAAAVEVSEHGILEKALGIEINVNDDKVILTMKEKIDGLVADLKVTKSKNSPGLTTNRDDDDEAYMKGDFPTIVGKLFYIARMVRPDIAFEVAYLSRYQAKPTKRLKRRAMRIVEYLHATREKGIVFHKGKPGVLKLEGYVDSDFADDPSTRRSTTGFIFMLNGTPISWASRRQKMVTTSSTEAEYVAATEALMEGIWIRKMLTYLGGKMKPVTLFEDNKGVIARVQMEPYQCFQRSKHIDVKYHFVRERVKSGDAKLVYVNTAENPADVLTKSLSRAEFLRKVDMLIG